MQNQTTESQKSTATDLVNIILEDHKPIKVLIQVMKDSDREFAERKAAFEEFAPTLIAHAKPEEEVLYNYMKGKSELREEGYEGDVEHTLADQLLEECKRTRDEDILSAKIKVLAELVEHHIQEEERELLPLFKENSDQKERMQMADRFLKLKLEYLAAGDDNIIPDPKSEREGGLH